VISLNLPENGLFQSRQLVRILGKIVERQQLNVRQRNGHTTATDGAAAMAIVMFLTTLSGHIEKGPTPNCRGRFDSHLIANLDNHFSFLPDDRTER
jgi:hypothetical protein